MCESVIRGCERVFLSLQASLKLLYACVCVCARARSFSAVSGCR